MKIFSIILLTLFLVGCGEEIIRTEYLRDVDTVEVYKPVPCKVEGFTCDFTGDNYIPTYKLLTCVIMQKKIIEICTGKNNEVGVNSSTDEISRYLNKKLDEVEGQFFLTK